jgi:hypothetical protein
VNLGCVYIPLQTNWSRNSLMLQNLQIYHVHKSLPWEYSVKFTFLHSLSWIFVFILSSVFISVFPHVVSSLQVLQPKCCMHFLVFPVCYISTLNNLLDIITITILSFIGYASNYYDGACAGLLGSSTPTIALYNINTISPKLKSDHQQKSLLLSNNKG